MDAGALVRYSIFDPTGNITALVESAVEVSAQPAVAARIMEAHPAVEQVGFVGHASGEPDGSEEPSGFAADATLRMAGGEFCGNATMSAAAWHLMHAGEPCEGAAEHVVQMRVSGAADPVEVRLCQTGVDAFDAAVHMPPARGVDLVTLAWGEHVGEARMVSMEGISHVVIEPDSPLFCLREERAAAEQAVRAWCAELACDGLGLMFYEPGAGVGEPDAGAGEPGERGGSLTPLVYVPGGDTVFWENSCASGSAAVACAAAARQGEAVSLALAEPGGTLRAESDPDHSVTWLRGSVRQVGTYEL